MASSKQPLAPRDPDDLAITSLDEPSSSKMPYPDDKKAYVEDLASSEKEKEKLKAEEAAVVDRFSVVSRPPSYSEKPERPVEPPPAEIGTDKRRRRRLVIVLAIALALIVLLALVLGLAIGLTRHSSNGNAPQAVRTVTATPTVSASASSATNAPPLRTGFPIGRYTFEVALTSNDSSCTTNYDAWRCEPGGAPYDPSQPNSAGPLTQFYWEIQASGQDLFLKNLPNTPGAAVNLLWNTINLTPDLIDPTIYRFRQNVQMTISPTLVLRQGIDQGGELCYYNQTTISGVIYANNTQPEQYSDTWPGSTYLTISSGPGPGTPDCYPLDANKNINGPSLGGLSVNTDATFLGRGCSCTYAKANGTYY